MRRLCLMLAALLAASPAQAEVVTIIVQLKGKAVQSSVRDMLHPKEAISIGPNEDGVYRSDKLSCKSNRFKVEFQATRYAVRQNDIPCVDNVVKFVVYATS